MGAQCVCSLPQDSRQVAYRCAFTSHVGMDFFSGNLFTALDPTISLQIGVLLNLEK